MHSDIPIDDNKKHFVAEDNTKAIEAMKANKSTESHSDILSLKPIVEEPDMPRTPDDDGQNHPDKVLSSMDTTDEEGSGAIKSHKK